MADTRGIQQDDLHQRSIAAYIKKHTDSVTAVLVLANGTVPRGTGGMGWAFSTLSAMFPKTLAKNIALVFTNVSSPLHWNFCQTTVPGVLRDAPQFVLDNPVALQKKYLKLGGDPKTKNMRTEMRKVVNDAEQGALETLVNLFDWLDGLEPQPAVSCSPCLYLTLGPYPYWE